MAADRRVLPGADHLTPFWSPIEARTVLRAAWLASVWVLVSALIAAASVAAVALIGAAVTAISGFLGNSIALSETTRRTSLIGGGIGACGAIIASSWAAAYASTKAGSRWRMLAGSAVGVALGLGLVGLGSWGAPAAALAGGWGIAIPSDRIERAALRSLPLALVALLPVLRADGEWLSWFLAGVGGVAAAWIWIAIAEGIWAIVARFTTQSAAPGGIMQSKTQLDKRPGEEASPTASDRDTAGKEDSTPGRGSPAEREEKWRTST